MDADVHIEIHNGIARRVRTQILSEGPLDRIAPLLEARIPVLSPVMPRSSIMHWYDGSNPRNRQLRLLCEIPPNAQRRLSLAEYVPSPRNTKLIWCARILPETPVGTHKVTRQLPNQTKPRHRRRTHQRTRTSLQLGLREDHPNRSCPRR